MSFKLFDVVSVEERNDVVETTMDVLEVVAMEDADHDVSIVANEINGQIAAMESSLEVADSLDAKIAVEEVIVEAGTATQGIAQMAMVSLQTTAALVGMDPSKFAISNESMEANPTTALKVSLESAKETFKAIIEKIKAFFSKVWSNIKKMSGKLLLMVTNYEKTFKSLEEKAGKLGAIKEGEDGKLSESQQTKLAMKEFAKVTGAVANDAEVNVEKMAGFDMIDTIAKTVGDGSGDWSKVPSSRDVTAFIEKAKKSYDGIPEIKADDKVIISRFDGNTIKGEIFTYEVKDAPKHSVINFKSFTATGKKDVAKTEGKKIEVMSVADIKILIGEGSTAAGKAKTITNDVDNTLKSIEAALGKAKESTVEADKAHGTNLSRLSTAGLRHTSAILLGYIAGMKNKASIAQIYMSKYQVAK